MTFAIKVEGGTGAGRKRPLRERPLSWECACTVPVERGAISFDCIKIQPGYLTRCSDCGAARPK